MLFAIVLFLGLTALGVGESEEGDTNQETEQTEQNTEAEAQGDGSEGEQGPGEEESGQDEGSSDSDTFTKIDPSTLPPELQPVYKSMQGDYTRKTQAVAEEKKATQRDIEIAQQVLADPDVQELLKSKYQQQGQPTQTAPQGQQSEEEVDVSKLTPEEAFERAVDMKVNERIKELDGKYTPVQEMLVNQHCMSQVETTVSQLNQLTKENGYPPFENYRQAIVDQLKTPADPTGSQAVKQLVLAGKLRPALETMYKNLAFGEIRTAEKENARAEVTQKKKANIPSSTVSPDKVDSTIDFSGGMHNAIAQSIAKNRKALEASG